MEGWDSVQGDLESVFVTPHKSEKACCWAVERYIEKTEKDKKDKKKKKEKRKTLPCPR